MVKWSDERIALAFLLFPDHQEIILSSRLPAVSRFMVLFRELTRRAEVDRAVVYGVLTTVWGVVSGPVSLVLIATRFSPEVQGFYYTFGSVLALRVFAELGLGGVIARFASHEWAALSLDDQGRIVGRPEALSRLVSLGRIAFRWYLVASGGVAVGLGLAGYVFFAQSSYPGVNWVAPWFTLCILSSMNLYLVPAWSLLEGCNQVSRVYAFRLILGILSSLSVWAAILSGAGLWAAAIAAAVGIVWSGVFLGCRYRRFFKPFFSSMVGPSISWRFEIWPMQWRIALSWLSGYFTSSIFTPVLFHYHGALAAGQMGMTWSLAATLGAIASTWSSTKAPRFGMLIARREYSELDRLLLRVATASITVLISGALAIWCMVYVIYTLGIPLSKRLLPPLPTGLFLAGVVMMNCLGPVAVYLRAHKKEPFVLVSIGLGVLIGLSTWFLGSRFAATGVAIGYLAVAVFVSVPWNAIIWYRCRAAWHWDSDRSHA